ncbi:MAG: DNA-binding transcriptional ArsR family regulator [Natronomonas sp.]|jgi:DNA-binding transcriptional ArsR family regulator
MGQVFPLRSSVDLGDREPRLVDMDDERADEVFGALASGTTRQVLSALHGEPQTASDLAEVTDTSVQNTQYHLEKLRNVDLVEPVDT